MHGPCVAIHASVPIAEAERQAALSDLDRRLAQLPADAFAEIRIDRGGFPSLLALLHGPNGILILTKEEADAGFSSRNPGYAGPGDAMIDYVLSNGQRDSYPAAWAYPRAAIFEALRSFAKTGRLEGISWHDDSRDP